MNIAPLLTQTSPPVTPDDTIEQALGLMMELRVRHLPVVDMAGGLVGLISEEQLLEADGPDALIETLLGGEPVSVRPDAHVFELTKLMMEHDLTAVPVAGPHGRYHGLVRRHDVFERFARMLATQEQGTILALEVDPRDYALSQLTYLIEQNGIKILSISSELPTDPEGTIRVTLKLNVRDTSRVRYLLEHNGYQVVAVFGEEEGEEELLRRVQEFMRYLEV